MKILRGIYLIPHAGNYLNGVVQAESGSARHINKGIEKLRYFFQITPYILEKIKIQEKSAGIAGTKATGKKTDKNKFKGALRDIRCLIKNHRHFFKHYRYIKSEKPDFIYERSEYLNLNGVIIARLLKIPHFYEANWIHYQGIQQFYLSYLNPLARRIESWMYNRSNHTFFVGNQHKHLNLKAGKWSVIQNGVEKSIIERFASHQINIEGKVQFCVLANLMPHHRFDVLSKALHLLAAGDRSKFQLHLIGFNFEPVLSGIPEGVEYIYYGPKEKEEIYALLSKMHVAVISGGPQYSSFMKLYDYAAVKLAVICPVLENIVDNFSEDEIVYFRNEDADDLAHVIKRLVDEPILVKEFGNRLFEKVKRDFTWETIFEGIAATITSQVSYYTDKTTRTQLNINAK